MNAQVRPALQSDADAVAVFLNRYMNARIPVERWHKLFHLPWAMPADAPDYGRVAVSRGEVVGFAGRIYSERFIEGRPHLIANLNSWYLRKDHRSGSLGLRLHKEMLDTRGQASFTVLSIARRTYPIYDRWGFGMLDEHRWLWRRSASSMNSVEVLTDRKSIERELDAHQQQMLHDHRQADLWPALIRTDAGDCLAVITAKRKRDHVLFLDVLHLSRPGLFEEHATQIANLLLRDDNSVLAVDSRFLSADPPGGERVPIPVPRRYISDRLSPASLDIMYSEIVLLNHKLS
ncbi:MAG: hypothetical protein OET44_18310 [Gammaproteobacteria bacterium]|nr:hypothetical protein [Gammaproteobacteria bacterium]